MARVINDVETLHKFRNDLLDTVDGLREQLKKTEHAVEEVSSVWKDLQFRKYSEDFSEDMGKIMPLCEDIEAFESDVLYVLEKRLKNYLFLGQ